MSENHYPLGQPHKNEVLPCLRLEVCLYFINLMFFFLIFSQKLPIKIFSSSFIISFNLIHIKRQICCCCSIFIIQSSHIKAISPSLQSP
ncbi:unnamed protein product [Meloidogyne enterolobii]|uniref:Uncharacterized protein n=2 Tax=Meloidogyne enterolobii TaxID=390850 RepID=A0ACB1A0F3_MELEN|nr:unnamed protein product [Meloidogyne enterolobii]